MVSRLTSVLPENGSPKSDAKASELQTLKNQLNQYKLQNDLLGHQLENHRQQMSNVLQDKSIITEELAEKNAYLKSLQDQVVHQTKQREANLQKLADLNSRVEYTQARKQDTMKTFKLQSVLISKTTQEVAFVEQRMLQENTMLDSLKIEIDEKRKDRPLEREPTVVMDAPTKSIGRPELIMLQEAHNEISSLTLQAEKLAQEIETLKTITNTLEIRTEITLWENRSKELLQCIEETAALDPNKQRLLDICNAVFAGEYDDSFDPKPIDTRTPDHTVPEPIADNATKLLMPIVDSLLRPMRYLPRPSMKRTLAKRKRYMNMVQLFHENLLVASKNSDNIVEALQKALAKGSFSMFRAHFARYRVERVWLRKMMLKQKCSFMGVTTKLKATIRAKQNQFAAKKEAYEQTVSELEDKVQHLMKELEVRSGSEYSLKTIHNFYTTQMTWLNLVVERDEIDLVTLEQAVQNDDSAIRTIGMDILHKKKLEKTARCLQIQTGCVNVEKDIRLLEWQQKQNPTAQWVSPNVKWTASGDSQDADTQTDTAYVFTQELWKETRPFQVEDQDGVDTVMGDVDISLVTGEEFLARCMLMMCGSQTQLFLYGNLEHVHLSEESSPRKAPVQSADAAANMKATPQTGRALAKLLEIEYVREKPRLRLTGQDERREEASRSVTYLELDCLYNDHQLYSCAMDFNGVPFSITLVQCKKTKYGMCFVHIRIYQPITGWLRWCTINARDFCRSLGFSSINALISARGPSINEDFMKCVVEAFKEDLAACDFFTEMATAVPSLQDHNFISSGELKFAEKAMMINTYTGLHGASASPSDHKKKKKKRANADAQFKMGAQEIAFVKCIFSLDKDATASLEFQIETLMDGDEPQEVRDAARKALRKMKKERKRKGSGGVPE